MTIRNGVWEDVTLCLDCAKTHKLQDQHFLRTRPHFVKPAGQLAAAALQAKATAGAHVLRKEEPVLQLFPEPVKPRRSDAEDAGVDPEILRIPLPQLFLQRMSSLQQQCQTPR